MFFVVWSSVQVLKAATFKRFSVHPCCSPILLRLQNSIAGLFQCNFNKISEHFLQTTMNWYFGTKKEGVNIGHQLFFLSQELLQKRPKFRFFKFLLKVSFRHHFQGLMFKERPWPRKSNKNVAFVGKEKKFFFWRNQVVFCKIVS